MKNITIFPGSMEAIGQALCVKKPRRRKNFRIQWTGIQKSGIAGQSRRPARAIRSIKGSFTRLL